MEKPRPIAPAAAAPPIFLHTGWRSGGTWLWGQFRAQPRVMGYYEPLHDQIGALNERRIDRWRADGWHSGHALATPYYREYLPLLRPHRNGVTLHRARFAADGFFTVPGHHDPELHAYLTMLLENAAATGRQPVLKFCRSLGRVGWMREQFPEAFHLLVLRDPRGQWESGRRQYCAHRNPYFIAAPFLVLARNAASPWVAEVVEQFGVRLPRLVGGSVALDQEICWRHARRLDEAECYRGFLAFWLAANLSALQGAEMSLDFDRLMAQPAYAEAMAASIQARTGLAVALKPRPLPPAQAKGAPRHSAMTDCQLPAAFLDQTHAAALALVARHAASLEGPARNLLRRKLSLESYMPGETAAFASAPARPAPSPLSGWSPYVHVLRGLILARRVKNGFARLIAKS